MILQRCTHSHPCYDDGKCHYKGECGHKAPLTNADRIRSMTDEELADWLARTQIANVAEALEIANIPWERKDSTEEETKRECLEWLQQPAEEDDYA